MVCTVSSLSVYVLCEDFPLWLLVLDRSICSHLYLGMCEKREDIEVYGEEFNKILEHVGTNHITLLKDESPPVNTISLAHGSYPYLKALVHNLPTRSYLLLDTPWRKRSLPKPIFSIQWFTSSSTEFGCAVDFRFFLGVKGMTRPDSRTHIRRSL